jgi:serine/threonine protein kinase
LQRGALTLAEIGRIAEAVGAALAYAHEQGVLHRDVKPSNVLLGTDGRIYLTDFGLARIAQAGESTLSSDRLLGTPQYISPEQALGKGDLDARTDIYAFGVMLYEMLLGRVPYNADTPYAIIHDHIYAPLPRPRDLDPNLPLALERVLLKALAKQPEDRFADVPALMEALRQALTEAEGFRAAPAEPPRGLVNTLGNTSSVAAAPAVPEASLAPTAVALPEAAAGGPSESRPAAEAQPEPPPSSHRGRRWLMAGA